LEETLLKENKSINDQPLHASKLERSLKNMEGIAKLTGSKQSMMTPVNKPLLDMKVNVTLSAKNSNK
jgi:hypothetical protein